MDDSTLFYLVVALVVVHIAATRLLLNRVKNTDKPVIKRRRYRDADH